MADDPAVLIHKCMGGLRASTVSFLLTRWNDTGNITHNKSTILVELINKEETALFHTVSKMDRQRQARTSNSLFDFSTHNNLSLLSMFERINVLLSP